MVDDLKFKNEDTEFDFEVHSIGVHINIYDYDNYMSFPLTIEDIKKLRDYLNVVIEYLE